MKIQIAPLPDHERKPKVTDPTKLGFGRVFTDRMFSMHYTERRGWHDARIHKYGPLQLDPAATVFHYAQEIFEGMKAYPRPHGGAALFRPEMNIRRMNASARRMSMPEVDPDLFLEALERLIELEHEWIPQWEGTSLYIRPTMIGTEAALGVKAATEYLFYIILSAVGAYFPSGFKPVTIEASDSYVRAVRGGCGYAKTGANYAPTLLPATEAKKRGCDQVLWLDALENKYVEEMGGMNVFFVFGKTLVTSPLTGTILPGVTRHSIIELAREVGIHVEERPLSIDEVMNRGVDGSLTEAFASGTAAVVTAIGQIVYKGRKILVADGQPGKTTRLFYKTLTDIQYGRIPDTRGWMHMIPERVARRTEATA
ncbi:MAG: branched-chain amino acid aminotransferase [Planctomycetota bacterium]